MYDIIIIGSGPAGLSAAVYAVRAGKKILVVEKDYEGSGQIASGSLVNNYLGLPGISGYDLGEKFRAHALGLGAEIITGKVISLEQAAAEPEQAEFEITVKIRKKEETFHAKTVIYCAGAEHRKLGADGEERLLGKGVSYCATCDGSFYQDKTVVVVGGGDTALDDALYLSELASKVTLVHRRDVFRGAKVTLDRLKAKENVSLVTGVNIKEIRGENHVESVLLDNGDALRADAVFVAVGTVPQTQLLKDSETLSVQLDEGGYVLAGEDGKTAVKGLFVAGDVRSKSLRQVVTAVSDGANAVHAIVNQFPTA